MPREIVTPTSDPGFYGKVPSHGDFVSRRLPRAFITPWDEWLRQGLAYSREQLVDRWLEIYLISPLWRFVLSEGVCADGSWAGVLMPSVDRVGRHFPLTIAACLPEHSSTVELMVGAEGWFSQIEQIALSCLEDTFELDVFDRQLQEIGLPQIGIKKDPACRPSLLTGQNQAWRFKLPSVDQVSVILPGLTEGLLQTVFPQHSLWETLGSDRISSSLLLCEKLPPVPGFAALLDGRWTEWGWHNNRY